MTPGWPWPPLLTSGPRRFYESPSTDVSPQGPDAIFEPEDVARLLHVGRGIRTRAEVD